MNEDGTTRLLRLVALVQDGDQRAINDLIAEYRERFVLIAHRMLERYPDVVNRVQTDDVVQNASLRLTRALKNSVVQEKLLASGHTADLIRLSAEMIRRELLDLNSYYGRRPETRLTYDPPGGSSFEADKLRDWEAFHEAVASLPENLRDVFDHHYYHGFPNEVTARLLGVSVRSVQLTWLKAVRWITVYCRNQRAKE